MSEPVKAWRKAVEEGDLNAITRMHGPETIVFPVDRLVVKGTQGNVKSYAELFKKYDVGVKIEDARYINSDRTVTSWGMFTLTLKPKNGGETTITRGRFTDVVKWVGGPKPGWCYIVDHASVPSAG
ncbi:DUF4440 domain-containing protein [Streptomyces sp. TM32]|uniref:YybH family protein n=1 Tax=Streptomyces sp. TM32 TaxID=1652669 RepID=UPI0013874374|nr:DUF4440 domain-containing protein [Streptomyces sp. TM32]